MPAFESQRLEALRKLEPFAPSDDPVFYSLVSQAMESCNVPVGYLSLVDQDEQRCVACVGRDLGRTDRSASFCAHAILEPGLTVVEDTHADPRFRDNPFVVDPPHVRFYVGAPIRTSEGMPVGTLCVIDFAPRQPDAGCLSSLRSLASIAAAVLETRRLFGTLRPREASPESFEIARARLDELLLVLAAPRSG